MNVRFHSKLPLTVLPTPLERLPRLSRELGLDLYIKRDDLTTPAGGGNKVRKLEFLLSNVLESGSQVVMTTGAVQSNHCRQTAFLAAKLGLEAHLVLVGEEPAEFQGNLLLDALSGATLHFTSSPEEAEATVSALLVFLSIGGKKAILIPYGGSNSIGVQGYVQAWLEMQRQAEAMHLVFDSVVLSSSSGGTQSGLLLGQQLFGGQGKIIGISAGPSMAQLESGIRSLIQETATALGVLPQETDILVNDTFVGPGYAIPDERTIQAILRLARTEAILLDPVYTGKAFAGLLSLAEEGKLGKRVLFWHTGGSPALYGYGRRLLT